MNPYIKQSLSKIKKICKDDCYVLITKKYAIFGGESYVWNEEDSWLNTKDTVETILANVGLTNDVSREDILRVIEENKGWLFCCNFIYDFIF